MNLLILRAAQRILVPVILVYSIALLVTGHHAPGGGFVGGLLAASAFTLRAVVRDPARREAHTSRVPRLLLAVGLLAVWTAAVLPVGFGEPFLSALETDLHLPPGVTVGTALLFETGIYLVAAGAVFTVQRAVLRIL